MPVGVDLTKKVSVEEKKVESELGVQSFGATDRGLVRPRNEDQFLVAELSRMMRVQQSSPGNPG